MKSANLFVSKVTGALKSVCLPVDFELKTDNEGRAVHRFNLIDLIEKTISLHGDLDVDPEQQIDREWLSKSIEGDDVSSFTIDSVEGSDGEWLGGESTAMTGVGPIYTSYRLGGTELQILGVEDPSSLSMTTSIDVSVRGDALQPNTTYSIVGSVSISLM